MTAINERAPGLLDQSPWGMAHQAERSERIKQYPRRTPEAQADIAAAHAPPTAMEVAMQEIDHQVEQVARELSGCPTPGCGFQAGHMDRHPCGIPADVAIAAEDADRAALDSAFSNAALTDTPAAKQYGCAHSMEGSCPKCTPAVREMGRTFDIQQDAMQRAKAVRMLLERDGGVEVTPEQAMYGRLRRELAHALGVDRDTDWQTLLARASLPIRGETPSLPPDAIVLAGPEAKRYRAIQAAARKAQESAIAARADGAALLQLFQQFCASVTPGSDVMTAKKEA